MTQWTPAVCLNCSDSLASRALCLLRRPSCHVLHTQSAIQAAPSSHSPVCIWDIPPQSCCVLIMLPAWEAETWHGQTLCFPHLVTPSWGGYDPICHLLPVVWKKEKTPAWLVVNLGRTWVLWLRKRLGAEGSSPQALPLTQMSSWSWASHLTTSGVWTCDIFLPPVACLTSLHQCACVLLWTTTKMPEQLKLASFLALGFWTHLPYFPLSLEKKSSVPQRKTKPNNENLCLSLPVGGAKNYPGFHSVCCLMQHSAEPMLLQQQNREIPLLRLVFLIKAFIVSGLVAPRW